MTEPSLREYIVANMFDGDDSGMLTAPIKSHVDEIVSVVTDYQASLSKPIEADIELLKTLLTGGSSREWEPRPDYGEDVEALFDDALADALAWECYSCREDVGWVKWSVAERKPAITEPGGYSYTIHIECGHCGSTNYFDGDGNDVGED